AGSRRRMEQGLRPSSSLRHRTKLQSCGCCMWKRRRAGSELANGWLRSASDLCAWRDIKSSRSGHKAFFTQPDTFINRPGSGSCAKNSITVSVRILPQKPENSTCRLQPDDDFHLGHRARSLRATRGTALKKQEQS